MKVKVNQIFVKLDPQSKLNNGNMLHVQLRHAEYLIERKASKLGIYENYMKMKKR